jgi:hypothetical protein
VQDFGDGDAIIIEMAKIGLAADGAAAKAGKVSSRRAGRKMRSIRLFTN